MKPIPSLQDQGPDQGILEILKRLGSLDAGYPPELLAARRAAFVARVEQKRREAARNEERRSRMAFVKRLQDLNGVKDEYPSELLAARRASFLAQVDRLREGEAREELTAKDEEIIRLLRNIKSLEPEYSPSALTARRAAFKRQIARGGAISLLDALRSYVQGILRDKVRLPVIPVRYVMRTTLALAALLVAAFAGSLLFGNRAQNLSPAPVQGQSTQAAQAVATSTEELAAVICKPGYRPPLCLAKEFNQSDDLTYSGNGTARPAVAKDTRPGYEGVHSAAYVNDGLYGSGASWVSSSPNSWIKIDLGQATTINTVAFGRDRLGNFNDGDPGQFVIAVALADDMYADGVSTNDYVEYTQVFDSKQTGFDGIVSGPETIMAEFGPVQARFVKITFQNAGTAVDEVEVFMARPPTLAAIPTHKPKDHVEVLVLPASPTAKSPPTNTPSPAAAATPLPTWTSAPTNTALPTDTATPRPTFTAVPTDTPTPAPTSTPRPTSTPPPVPTDTQAPSNTPAPVPSNTAAPVPSDTPMPAPIDTQAPLPTNPPAPTTAPNTVPADLPTDTPSLSVAP